VQSFGGVLVSKIPFLNWIGESELVGFEDA
jgi:hypothetical protein